MIFGASFITASVGGTVVCRVARRLVLRRTRHAVGISLPISCGRPISMDTLPGALGVTSSM